MNDAGAPGAGLAASLRRLLATLLEVAQVRLDLLANEYESEKLRILDALVRVVVALLFLAVGLVLAAGVVVLWMPEHLRLPTAAGLAVLCMLVGAHLIRVARRSVASPAGGPIATTVDELRRDRAELAARD